MKKTLLFGLLFAAISGTSMSQTLYSSSVETGNRFNPGLTTASNPKIAFDDIQIPNAAVVGTDSIRITKLKVGIRRIASAPATTVSVYYTPVDDTASGLYYYSFIKIPPVLIGSVSLPANGATAVTTIVSFGDSATTLFRIKTDTSHFYKGYQTFFVGVGLSNPNADNGIRLATGGLNDDIMWIYNADSTVKRYATYFGGTPAATFYIQAFGYPVSSLPISLASFKGERRGNINNLMWSTASEANNTGFQLQRSIDGVNYSDLAFVASKAPNGNSSATINYNFDDTKPLSTNGYYRLKQIDKDGKNHISNVVLIKGIPVKALTVSAVYPNPVGNTINLVATTADQDMLDIRILDLSGKLLGSQTKQTVSGDNIIPVNTSTLSAGNYLLKVTSAKGEVSIQKFVKQ